jgi:hypothetical protein
VIRDEVGQVISSAWSLIPNCANAETAEAIACWEGIKHSISVRNTKLIVESDCANLIAKLGKPEDDMSHTLSIISNIQRLWSVFEDIKFTKIRREDSRVAHELARYSRVQRCNGVLLGSAPSCALELILNECNQNLSLKKG